MVLNPEFLVLGLEGFVGGAQGGNFHVHNVHVVAVKGRNLGFVANRNTVVAAQLVTVGVTRVEHRKKDVWRAAFVGAPVYGVRICDKGKRVICVVRIRSLLERSKVVVKRKKGTILGKGIPVIGYVGAVKVKVDGLPSGNTRSAVHKGHILLDRAVNNAPLGVFQRLRIGI